VKELTCLGVIGLCYNGPMSSQPSSLPLPRGRGMMSPLNLVVYASWTAIAVELCLEWRHGRLAADTGPLACGFGMIAMLALYIARAHLRAAGDADLGRLRLLTLLQIPPTLLAYWGLDGTNSGVAALMIFVAGQVAVVYPQRQTVLILLCANAPLALLLVERRGAPGALSDLLGFLAFQAFAALSTAYVRNAEATSSHLMRVNGELLATRRLLLESTRGEERLRLSRELHDVVGHKLTALKLQLRLLSGQVSPDGPASLAECSRLADELLVDVRGVVSALRAHDGIDLGQALAALVPALPHPLVRLELDPEARAAGLEQAQTLLRCAQEGLTNALRHGDADQIVIRLSPTPGGITVSVEDDGRAQQPPHPGNGLRGMRERLEGLGGRLDLEVLETGGLCLQAWLPQDDAPEGAL